MGDTDILFQQAVELLQQLISIPSFSREEDKTADAIEQFMQQQGITMYRKLNNLWAWNKHFDASKPTILLNSHHDTVKPNSGYTRDPFEPKIEDGKLYGLGSNDAGGCLVSLISTFLYFYDKQNLKYNFCLATTAEEEISGVNGLELIIPELGQLDVVGHVQVDVIGPQPPERLLEGVTQELRREVLLPLRVPPRHAGVAVKVVAELAPDLDPVPRRPRLLQPLAEQRLGAPVAVGVAVVEERDPQLPAEAAQLHRPLVGVVPPPVHPEDPAPQRNARNFQAGVSEFATFHSCAP